MLRRINWAWFLDTGWGAFTTWGILTAAWIGGLMIVDLFV